MHLSPRKLDVSCTMLGVTFLLYNLITFLVCCIDFLMWFEVSQQIFQCTQSAFSFILNGCRSFDFNLALSYLAFADHLVPPPDFLF